jgi:hypothetical protein
MRVLTLTKLATVLAVLLSCASASAQQHEKQAQSRFGVSPRTSLEDAELVRFRTDVIEKMRETRAEAEKLLALHENERQRRAEEYHRQRELYDHGLVARNDVVRAEHALAQAVLKVDEDKRWLAETDMAITEVAMRDELLRLPKLALGGYSENRTLLRFHGATPWKLGDLSKIEKFFVQTFGRALPISALGQTATHDRLRFDHRDAMDVALHPDSKEGQSLLTHLRQAGIPFIAFRNAVPGASTGAHIHIGKPSPRL